LNNIRAFNSKNPYQGRYHSCDLTFGSLVYSKNDSIAASTL